MADDFGGDETGRAGDDELHRFRTFFVLMLVLFRLERKYFMVLM